MAERVGFEPTHGINHLSIFKTELLIHLSISPYAVLLYMTMEASTADAATIYC